MPQTYVLLPMFALVLLTFGVVFAMLIVRTGAVRRGEIRPSYYELFRDGAEPELAHRLSRQFLNLFETPVLFYAACLAALATGQATPTFQLVCWGYVALRFLHAAIHLGSNPVLPRLVVYFCSWVVLLVLWTWLVVGVVGAG